MGSVFESIVGGDRVGPSEESFLDGVPLGDVVQPSSPEEVAACLRLASADGIALLCRGAGTKLGWGNIGSAERFVVLDLSGLCAEPEIEPEEGIARVEAGVPVRELEERLAERGRRARLPSAYAGATLGGSVAVDPPDPGRSLDRTLRDDLLGMQVALANGTLTRAGGRVVKNVTGFDLVRMYCGSFGTLGVITEVVLRLRPLPERERTLGRELGSIEAAQELVAELVERGVEPEAALIEPYARGVRLLWRLAGTDPDVAQRADRVPGEPVGPEVWGEASARLVDPCESGQASLRLGGRGSEVGTLWRALEAESGRQGPVVALPLSGVVRAEVEPNDLAGLIGHAGSQGWACFVETCPAEHKAGLDVFGPAPGTQTLLRELKRRFDPAGVLAPGRFMGRL